MLRLTFGLLLAALPLKARAAGPEADRLLLDGLDALYRLDFTLAQNRFETAGRLEPQSPAGPFFLSGLYWLQFSQNADLPNAADLLLPRFEEQIALAIERSRALLAKRPDDPEANFYMGAAYGMRGRWQILNRQWLRAALNGYKGYKYLQRTVQADPQYYDAYLGLGMYDYYSDTLPTVLRLASLVVARGDKQRGLRYLRQTIEKGHYSRTEAQLFLVGLYAGYEHKPELAVELVRDLRRQSPDNPFFTLLDVIVRIDAQDWDGAAGVGEQLAPLIAKMPYAAPQSSLFDMYLGEAYLGGRRLDKALEVFSRCIVQAPDPRKGAVTYCELRRAQTYDLLGRRAEALEDYKDVRRKVDFFDSQEKARLGMRKPADYDTVVRQLTRAD